MCVCVCVFVGPYRVIWSPHWPYGKDSEAPPSHLLLNEIVSKSTHPCSGSQNTNIVLSVPRSMPKSSCPYRVLCLILTVAQVAYGHENPWSALETCTSWLTGLSPVQTWVVCLGDQFGRGTIHFGGSTANPVYRWWYWRDPAVMVTKATRVYSWNTYLMRLVIMNTCQGPRMPVFSYFRPNQHSVAQSWMHRK